MKSPSWRHGFTLVEMMMAMLLATVVLAGVVLLFSSSNRAFVAQDQVVTMEQNIRGSLEILAFELQMAGYVPQENLAAGAGPITADVSGQSWTNGTFEKIEEASATALTFVADMNADNDAETVRYSLNGTVLTRESWQWERTSNSWVAQTAAPVPLAYNVTAMNIVYSFEDGDVGIPDRTDGDTTNDPDDVRTINISLTVKDTDQAGVTPKYRTLQSAVKLRNMGLES